MRVVSLNLDLCDAAALRRGIARVLSACSCAEDELRTPCVDCLALAALMAELDRLVRRPALGRTPRGVRPLACREPGLALDRIPQRDGELAGPRRLRLVGGGLADARTVTDRQSQPT